MINIFKVITVPSALGIRNVSHWPFLLYGFFPSVPPASMDPKDDKDSIFLSVPGCKGLRHGDR